MASYPKTVGEISLKVKNQAGEEVSRSSGGVVSAFLQTKDLDFGSRNQHKYVDAIIAEFLDTKRPELVNITVGYRDSLKEPRSELAPFPLNELEQTMFFRITARYLSFKIQSDSVGVQWRLGAFSVYGTTHGGRL